MKPTIVLVRDVDVVGMYTLGHLEVNGREICKTLEEPWRDNKHGVSRIPAGRYTGFIRKSHLHGGNGFRDYDVPELIGVPNRTNVQIHRGNTLDDTEGCVLVGRYFGKLRGERAVLASADAFTSILPYFGQTGFNFIVEDRFGCPVNG